MRVLYGVVRAAALAVVLIGSQVCWAQKNTVDPNTGPAVQKTEAMTDPRLAQKISYETWHTPVRNILADLSERTGVTLNSGYSKQDWQVRDRRMNILVHDVTLAELMNSIARVMKFRWSISEHATPPTYRLVADRRLIATLQAEATRRENELGLEVSRRRAAVADAFEQLSEASEVEIERLRETDPYLYMSCESGFAKLVAQLFREKPGLREAYTCGNKNVKIPYADLSSQSQQLFTDALKSNWKYHKLYGGSQKLQDSLDRELPKLNIHMGMANGGGTQLSDFGTVYTAAGNEPCIAGEFRHLDSQATQMRAQRGLASVDSDTSELQFREELEKELLPAHEEEQNEIESYLMYDPVVEQDDEPSMHTKVSPKISDEARKAIAERVESEGHGVEPRLLYEAAQKAIVGAAGFGIVSDSFNAISGEYSVQDTETELVTLLDVFCKSYCCNWEKRGSVLELRRRDWFRRRASQVPDEWLQPWREQLRSTGTMDLDSFLRMATLTREQKWENIDPDRLLSEALGVRWEINDHEGLMRFYLRLSHTQRSALFSGGLDPNSLNPEQWQSYREMFHYGRKYAWGTEVFSKAGRGQALVTASTAFANNRREYYFRVTLEGEDGMNEQSFHVYLPNLQPAKDGGR